MKKKKVTMYKGEWYPVYVIIDEEVNDWEDWREIPESLLREWEQVKKKFNKLQEELKKIYEEK